MNSGKLYCVALPIGNPKDFTDRGRLTLESVDLVAPEDTRVFKDFCCVAGLNIRAEVISYFDAKETEKAPVILEKILTGKNVALVSDAGTPNIYDPGYRILTMAFNNGIEVVPIPGCSSVTAALSICPLPGLNFCFYGFPPEKSKGRQELFRSISFEGRIVFFESPHRIIGHLEDAAAVWGPNKRVFICRELTKKYEEKLLITIRDGLERFAQLVPKGEFVLIYEGTSPVPTQDPDGWLRDKINEGLDPKEILKEAQSRFKLNRKDIYNRITILKKTEKKR